LLGSGPGKSPYTGGWTAVALVSSTAATNAMVGVGPTAGDVVASAWFTADAALTTADTARKAAYLTKY